MKISTIKDIAKETGLGIATISSYLNGGNVRPKNKELIEAAIEKLDYRVNEIARSLKTDKTKTIGVIIPELDDAYFSKVVASIGELLNKKGYGMLVVDFGLDIQREIEAVDFLCSKRVDGIIDMPSNKTGEHLDRAIKHKVPIVLFDRSVDGHKISTIKTDNYTAISIAVEHLKNNGHRNIGFISGDQTIVTAKERERGYFEACEKFGLPIKQTFVERSDFVTTESASDAMKRVYKRNPSITAVIAANLVNMIGSLQALNELDCEIPQDISFIGFDDSRFAKAFHPELTIVLQPIDVMARQIVDSLLHLVEGGSTENTGGILNFNPYLQIGKSVKVI